MSFCHTAGLCTEIPSGNVPHYCERSVEGRYQSLRVSDVGDGGRVSLVDFGDLRAKFAIHLIVQ